MRQPRPLPAREGVKAVVKITFSKGGKATWACKAALWVMILCLKSGGGCAGKGMDDGEPISARDGVMSLGNNVKIVKNDVGRIERGSLEKWIGDGDLLVISGSIDEVIGHVTETRFNVEGVVLGNVENQCGGLVNQRDYLSYMILPWYYEFCYSYPSYQTQIP